jgi:hypothetical protein
VTRSDAGESTFGTRRSRSSSRSRASATTPRWSIERPTRSASPVSRQPVRSSLRFGTPTSSTGQPKSALASTTAGGD